MTEYNTFSWAHREGVIGVKKRILVLDKIEVETFGWINSNDL
jgi:hypothetical protein